MVYSIKYGSGTVDVPLEGARVLGELHGRKTPPVADIASALRRAVDSPIESPPLRQFARPGDRVALVVSDMSRFWMRQDCVIPHLVEQLTRECGVSPEAVDIVVANGTHMGGSEAELRTLVTDGVYNSVRVTNHDCLAPGLVELGTTSYGTPVRINPIVANADKVVCLGACAHHVMAGFGGGRKSILPGVSGMETIKRNHALALDPVAPRSNPRIGNGVLAGNPLHADMCEAAVMVKSLFMVNLVMNAEMELAYITAGHWLHSWERACEAANAIYQTPIEEKADAIIAGCGGYPKDMSLYQGTKTIDNVETGLKENGTLIVLMECREGGEPREYFDWLSPLAQGRLAEKLRESFTIPGYIFFLNCEQARRYRVMLLTSLPAETLAPMGIEAYSDIHALLAAANLAGKSVYVIPNGSTVIPQCE